MRTANPALNENTFGRFAPGSVGLDADHSPASTMSLQGTVNKTAMLLVLLTLAAGWTWHLATRTGTADLAAATPWMIGGLIGGFVLAMVTIFKPTTAPFTAVPYALCQGLFLGAISAMFEARFPGIVFQAVGLTFGTLFALLAAYSTGLIRATENFKLGVTAATGGIALLYLVGIVLSFFGVGIPYIHESGPIGIGFSLVVVVIAALNLVLDFDFIETGVERGAPKSMEWFAAFGLLVTLVWLYLEILRLLAKLRDR